MLTPVRSPRPDWFDAGYAAFSDRPADPSRFPPLDDAEAQRQWRGGFGAAWVKCPAEEGQADDWLGGESVEEALVRVLDGQEDLLRQLWAQGLGKIPRMTH